MNVAKTRYAYLFLLTQLPILDETGRVLLPPALQGQGCPYPAYVSPRQARRIMKRREARRRLIVTGRMVVQRAVSSRNNIISVFSEISRSLFNQK